MKTDYKIIERLKNTYLSTKAIFSIDMVLSAGVSFFAITFIPFILTTKHFSWDKIFLYLAVAVVSAAIMFVALRTSKIIIRHFGTKDLFPFAFAALLKGVLLFLVVYIACLRLKDTVISTGWLITIIIVDIFGTFVALIGARMFMIFIYNAISSKMQEKYEYDRVLIYGSSDKSVAVKLRLQNSKHYKIIGFIERSNIEGKMLLEQLPLLHFNNDEQMQEVITYNMADAILFARDGEAQAEENGLIKFCAHNNIKVLVVPSVDEVTEGGPILRPREVRVEDLLGRQEIKVSIEKIKQDISDKVVMVTGAAGSIGSELVRQLAHFGVKKIVLYDNAETPMHNLRLELEEKFPGLNFIPIIGDVRLVQRLDFAFRSHHPQLVFHAAAYKHVPLMEENPCEAVLVNVFGSRNVADKCIEYGVEKMIMISTDKAVNPTNIMGCTKRLAEIYIQSLGLAIEKGEVKGNTKFITTRFGNVLGSNGSVIPRFREQIAKGGPVTVTHPDINRYFMTIPEACRLVLEAATMGTSNQIFVFDMGEPVKIDDLARRMITLAGFTPDVDIKVQYTGLRPGEKLYEEVLATTENTLPTFHDRIKISKVREYEYAEAEKVVAELTNLARAVEIPQMVSLMKLTVPEYKSKNSKFEELDKEVSATA